MAEISWMKIVVLASLVIIVIRPAILGLILWRVKMSWQARLFISWCGPRGLNTLLLTLLAVQAGLAGAELLVATVGGVVLISAFVHGATATPAGAWYGRTGHVLMTLSPGPAYSQTDIIDPASKILPNSNPEVITGWGKLPEGRTWGSCDVITAPNGDIFVADGHSGQREDPPRGATGRIMKFNKEGQYIKEWGRIGTAPGEFRTPHALAFDSRGRLFVADRGNHRIQIFDQEGSLLDTFYQFGRVSGLFIDADDTLYAIDSESDPDRHPGWKTGIRIGRATEDRVTAFIPPHETDRPHGAAGEGVAVDGEGNVYAAEGPASRPVAGGH